MKRVTKVCFALLGAAVVCAFLSALLLIRDSSRAFPALPSPNGYDDFIAAGNLLSSQTNDAYTMGVEPLRAFIATNSESLRLLHLGLTRTCSVPTEEFLTNTATVSMELPVAKRLAQLGAAAGRLAELEGRTNDAVAAYLTGMRFGNEISRGGFVMHRLVGVACEAIASRRLTTVATNLNATDAKGIIRALEKLEAEAVSWAEIDDNERRFIREAFRQSHNPIVLVYSWWALRPMLKREEEKHLTEIARRRLLIAELALRCHVSTHGKQPEQLNDLVPEYLTRVPLDPFTGQALIYRPNGTNWLLYSVGADRVDDGGTSASRAVGGKAARGDLRSDTP